MKTLCTKKINISEKESEIFVLLKLNPNFWKCLIIPLAQTFEKS
jgi:hypothetical protein